ncbi:ImmA/IrrE family metallo-endopeptidase [Treponema sp. R80B11-R83G3]
MSAVINSSQANEGHYETTASTTDTNSTAISSFKAYPKALEKFRETREIRDLLSDFYSIFPDIKWHVNELLIKDNYAKTNYTRNPLVKIEHIAKKLGLKIISLPFDNCVNILRKYIDKKNIPSALISKHAFIVYKEAIIFINKKDKIEEKLFSIAHEIFHYIFWREQDNNMAKIAEKKNIWTKQLEEKPNINSLKTIQADFAARDNKEIQKDYIAFFSGGTHLRHTNVNFNFNFKEFINDALRKDTSDIIEDEIADYFAANLLVPTERFILWEDKSDQEIAKAFKTVEACIQKRRTEVVNELNIMRPKNLSSGINLEKVAQ